MRGEGSACASVGGTCPLSRRIGRVHGSLLLIAVYTAQLSDHVIRTNAAPTLLRLRTCEYENFRGVGMNFDVHYALLHEFMRIQGSAKSEELSSAIIAVGQSVFMSSLRARSLLSCDELQECQEYAFKIQERPITVMMCSGRIVHIISYPVKIDNLSAGLIIKIEILSERVESTKKLRSIKEESNFVNRLELTERLEIVRTLRQMNGNRVKAALSLGISRSSLYRKMKIYGLETE